MQGPWGVFCGTQPVSHNKSLQDDSSAIRDPKLRLDEQFKMSSTKTNTILPQQTGQHNEIL